MSISKNISVMKVTSPRGLWNHTLRKLRDQVIQVYMSHMSKRDKLAVCQNTARLQEKKQNKTTLLIKPKQPHGSKPGRKQYTQELPYVLQIVCRTFVSSTEGMKSAFKSRAPKNFTEVWLNIWLFMWNIYLF